MFMADQPILVPYIAFPADPPPLLIRQPGDAGGPDAITRVTLADVQDHALLFTGFTTEGHRLDLTIAAYAPGVLHILLVDPQREDAQRITFARPQAHQPE